MDIKRTDLPSSLTDQIQKTLSDQQLETASEAVQQGDEATPSQAGIAGAPDVLEACPQGDSTRENYFSGQLLNAQDFQQEQDYFRDKNSPADQTAGVKKDFSTFSPEMNYTSVQMQQGRVQLDSDSSEKVFTEFSAGDLRDPLVVGNLWNSDYSPTAAAFLEKASPETRSLLEAAGNTLSKNLLQMIEQAKGDTAVLADSVYDNAAQLISQGGVDLSGLSIEDAIQIVMMQVAKDSEQDLKTMLNEMQGQTDSADETSLRLQMVMDRRSKVEETLANIMKKISSTQDILIQNLK